MRKRRRRKRGEEEEREKDREGQEVPSSPSISCRASRRLAGSHGLGGGWRVCSAEPPVLRGPQACLPQGPHSWCLLPVSSPARLWVQGKKRNFRSEQGNRGTGSTKNHKGNRSSTAPSVGLGSSSLGQTRTLCPEFGVLLI